MNNKNSPLTSELDEIKQINGTPDELDIICKVFNRNILQLTGFARKKEPNAVDLQALDDVVKELLNENATFVIDRCKDKIWGAKEYIKTQNADYFLNRDYSELIKQDSNESVIINLVSIIKRGWNTLYPNEKEAIWNKMKLMLKSVAFYEKWKRATSIE